MQPQYQSEKDFLKYADKQKTYIYHPQWFYFQDGTKYMPDFYCVEDETYIEVSSSYIAYYQNQHSYKKMKAEHPKIKFKIVLPDGRPLQAALQTKINTNSRQLCWQHKQKRLGMCVSCGKPAAEGYVHCKEHILKNRAKYWHKKGMPPPIPPKRARIF